MYIITSFKKCGPDSPLLWKSTDQEVCLLHVGPVWQENIAYIFQSCCYSFFALYFFLVLFLKKAFRNKQEFD